MKINNYQINQFLQLENLEEVENLLAILEHLKPQSEITNPLYRWWKIGKWKQPKAIKVRRVMECLFGEVEQLRMLMKAATPEAVIEAVSIVTNTNIKTVNKFTIVDFYSIINSITADLISIGNMEQNELSDEDSDPVFEMVRAGERMAKFGSLNIIDSLAGGDITKWSEIEKMPYMTVFTKLKMNKELAAINKAVLEYQRKKQN